MSVRRWSAAVLLGMTSLCSAQTSQWASFNSMGRLSYGHDKLGDRIGDFSFAGYKGGGVALPVVAAKISVAPDGQDDTAAIQKAIDAVTAMPLVDGERGAVELTAGVFNCSGTLTISASGVVLRGAGKATTLKMTGAPHLAIKFAGKLDIVSHGQVTNITDDYMPSGSSSFHVADVSGLQVGDTVRITKPVTEEWVHFMGMDGMERDGKHETWVRGDLQVERRIAAITDKMITLEIPLFDDYDRRHMMGHPVTVTKVTMTGQVSGVAVESLKVVAPAQSVDLDRPQFDGIHMDDAVDSWIQDVSLEEVSSGVNIASGTERVTVLRVDVVKRVPITSPAKPFQFSVNGSQILFDRCTGTGDQTFYFATQQRQQGPVVILHSRFLGNGHIQPHQRWSTGLLIDGCEVPGGGVDMMNRGGMGTGHGWPIGWSVAWNNRAKSLEMNEPPGTLNWSIGNEGDAENPPMPVYSNGKKSQNVRLQDVTVDSPGKAVKPESLYLAQLAERLGPAAVKAIGY